MTTPQIMKFPNRARISAVVRPQNCEPSVHDADAAEKARKPCPNCNQFHLRPGYCQALDPINAAKYPHLHELAKFVNTAVNSVNSSVNTNETPVNSDEVRKAYRREWMRKRRAKSKD
jgi:hypothetical protein